MNLRPSGYEPDELPDCSTPRRALHATAGPPLFKSRPLPSPAMRWMRRRRRAAEGEVRHEIVLAPRTERALVALAVHAQQLDSRIDRLERRLDEAAETALDLPSHSDVLEVRIHSAKVAAELARVAVELRAEIAEVRERQPDPAHEDRLRVFAEQVLELSDAIDTIPSDRHRGAA